MLLRALALALLLPACQSNPPVGLEGRGLSVRLSTLEAEITKQNWDLADRVVDTCRATLETLPGVEARLAELAEEAMSRARVRARSLSPAERSKVVAELATLQPSQVYFEWDTGSFAPAPLLSGQVSRVEGTKKGDALPDLAPGKVVYARVHLQVVPWPRDGSVELQPGTLLAQSKIIWWSDHPGAPHFINSLAVVLAERAAQEIQRCAEVDGLIARR
ncbi:MAG: hypothetical protein ACYTG5_05730 [Planctomycetota bacterium]|jgi:hypothetical protein